MGGKKRSALREAATEISERNHEKNAATKVKEVFQHEKYDTLTRTWKKVSLVLCTDPTMECDDLFDPALQESITNSSWQVDFSVGNIDADGWTYAYDFSTLNKTGTGESAPKWNSYVRRRKWRFTEVASTGHAKMDE